MIHQFLGLKDGAFRDVAFLVFDAGLASALSYLSLAPKSKNLSTTRAVTGVSFASEFSTEPIELVKYTNNFSEIYNLGRGGYGMVSVSGVKFVSDGYKHCEC
ncbi:hypothetical protein Hdeb2414_s0009g00308921 [Helianthus debilis subsp. tardiflorus]